MHCIYYVNQNSFFARDVHPFLAFHSIIADLKSTLSAFQAFVQRLFWQCSKQCQVQGAEQKLCCLD